MCFQFDTITVEIFHLIFTMTGKVGHITGPGYQSCGKYWNIKFDTVINQMVAF